MSSYPLSAITTNTNRTTFSGKSLRELDNFINTPFVGDVNNISIIRTNWEVGINRTTKTSSDLLEDSVILSIVSRFYDMSLITFKLSDVNVNEMPGLTYDERSSVYEYLIRNT